MQISGKSVSENGLFMQTIFLSSGVRGVLLVIGGRRSGCRSWIHTRKAEHNNLTRAQAATTGSLVPGRNSERRAILITIVWCSPVSTSGGQSRGKSPRKSCRHWARVFQSFFPRNRLLSPRSAAFSAFDSFLCAGYSLYSCYCNSLHLEKKRSVNVDTVTYSMMTTT